MPQKDLEIRVENLEKTVAGLVGLPKQVQELSTQFQQLRKDVRADISAVRVDVIGLRGEMYGIRDELRDEMHDIRDELRSEMRGMRDELVGKVDGCRDELRADMTSVHHDLAKAILDTRTLTLTLHEDLVERIKLLGEGFKSAAAAPPSEDDR